MVVGGGYLEKKKTSNKTKPNPNIPAAIFHYTHQLNIYYKRMSMSRSNWQKAHFKFLTSHGRGKERHK